MTAAALGGDCLHLEDMATVDAAGSIYIADPRDDLIIRRC
jgi:hypothetical protein